MMIRNLNTRRRQRVVWRRTMNQTTPDWLLGDDVLRLPIVAS